MLRREGVHQHGHPPVHTNSNTNSNTQTQPRSLNPTTTTSSANSTATSSHTSPSRSSSSNSSTKSKGNTLLRYFQPVSQLVSSPSSNTPTSRRFDPPSLSNSNSPSISTIPSSTVIPSNSNTIPSFSYPSTANSSFPFQQPSIPSNPITNAYLNLPTPSLSTTPNIVNVPPPTQNPYQFLPTRSSSPSKSFPTRSRNITIHTITRENIQCLREINLAVFPVKYNDKFYRDVADMHPKELSGLAYYNDLCIGGISCRLELESPDPTYDENGFFIHPPPSSNDDEWPPEYRAYIMTIGVLAPYRRLKIGSILLDHVTQSLARNPTVTCICLHVHISNDEAIGFYTRNGFVIEELVEGYYLKNKGVEPPHAYFLTKDLEPFRNVDG